MKFEYSKWVACGDPRRPASEFVREALAGRLSAVEHYLEPTSPDEAHDPEHVHQLRVSTRRADAAVRSFAEFLPRRKAKRLRRVLRTIRRAAGDARDHDVMALRYSPPGDESSAPAYDWLWSRIVDARRGARPGLDEIYRRCSAGQFAGRCERVLSRVRWRREDDEPMFAALAVETLTRTADVFFRVARSQPKREAELHQLRIAGKRFRYSIELFAAVAPTLREDVYSEIEALQEKLGKSNDHTVAAKRIASWRKRHVDSGSTPPEGVDKIIAREKKKATAARKSFRAWWTAERCAELELRCADAMRGAVKIAENTESQSARRQ
jgi:CHAD domain-containing protein